MFKTTKKKYSFAQQKVVPIVEQEVGMIPSWAVLACGRRRSIYNGHTTRAWRPYLTSALSIFLTEIGQVYILHCDPQLGRVSKWTLSKSINK